MNELEAELKEIIFISALSWFISTLISVAVLMIYWDTLGIERFTIELTLICCWNFVILGTILAVIFISVFLHRFKIVRKD